MTVVMRWPEKNSDEESTSGSDIWIPYIICCGYIMAVVIYMFILYMKNIISRLNTSHSETIDTRIGVLEALPYA